MPETRLVRLRTHNPKRGHVLQKYTVVWKGIFYRFEAARGWYRVPLSLANYLGDVPTQHGVLSLNDQRDPADMDDDFPRAFHVCDDQGVAENIDKREKKRALERAKPKEPHMMVTDLTTKDLSSFTSREQARAKEDALDSSESDEDEAAAAKESEEEDEELDDMPEHSEPEDFSGSSQGGGVAAEPPPVVAKKKPMPPKKKGK